MTSVEGSSQDHVLICYSRAFEKTYFGDDIRKVAKRDNPNLKIVELVGVGDLDGKELDDKEKKFKEQLKDCKKCIFVLPPSSANHVFDTEGPISGRFHTDLTRSEIPREVWYASNNKGILPKNVSGEPDEKRMKEGYLFATLLFRSGFFRNSVDVTKGELQANGTRGERTFTVTLRSKNSISSLYHWIVHKPAKAITSCFKKIFG